MKGCINIDLKDRSKRMDQVGSAWLPEYIQISKTYTFDFENTLKGWIKLDLLGYLNTFKFLRHILSLVDSVSRCVARKV